MPFDELDITELRDLSESMTTVAGAVDAGVFRHLHEAPASPAELARRAGLDRRAMEILLPFLAELGVLVEEAGRFRPSERARRELADPDSPDYAAGGLPLWLANLGAWTRLPDVLRSGDPIESEGRREDADEEERREAIARFMAGMAAAPDERVQRLVDGVLARRPDAGTALDLGGGPGHMSRAFVERGLQVTLLDRPEVVEFVDEEYGLAQVEALTTVGGDFLEDALPAGPFDVILLSNILHMLSPEQCRLLIGKAAKVAAPGAVLAVADFIRDRSPRAVRFAMVMLLRTQGGNTYTVDEHRGWCEEAGFSRPQVTDLDPDRQLLTLLKDD
jgi:2-polyprenyl-3-methyl-5-hydroxy-6-metoxy-1,4-benzoquinol methylase